MNNQRAISQNSILLVGGGGHCRSVIDVLKCVAMPIAGIVHGPTCTLEPLLGYPSLGRDAELPQLRTIFSAALVTVGQIKSCEVRKKLYHELVALDFVLPTIISPLAHVSSHAQIGRGAVVLHQALINAGAQVGCNCIINSKALVEHDCKIADHCHIAVGAIVCGAVQVGEGAFVGAGSVLREGIRIGEHAVIGCGLTVLRDIPPYTLYTGAVTL